MKILGIESSCDETAAAVVEDGRRILSNKIASQIEVHARYGGVVPEVASRQHMLAIVPVIEQALEESGAGWDDLDGIAVTRGPGLAGSLLVGLNMAKTLAFTRNLPLTGVNHLEGHIYANWLSDIEIEFPVLCLIVSGGHSDIVLMRGHGEYQLMGRTRDDAAGEAFDKAARVLGLGYPGGPVIQRVSQGVKATVPLPRARLGDSFDFSFSGVKTALLNMVLDEKISPSDSAENGLPNRANAAASFQEAVVEVLVTKTVRCALQCGVNQILVSGGVASNRLLREWLTEQSPVPVHIPPPVLCTDNAAMIAARGYFQFLKSQTDTFDLDATAGLKLS